MRIISGNFKGYKLFMAKNKSTRPLKDSARESIFNLLTHSNNILFKLDNSNILDLYAGTGSFGLECLSRNAKSVCFVENEKEAYNTLKKNIEKMKIKKQTRLFFSDVFTLMNKTKFSSEKFNLIFCDPPFREINIKKLIKLIFENNFLDPNGIIILHRDKKTKDIFPDCFSILDERIYGISKVIFGKFLR